MNLIKTCYKLFHTKKIQSKLKKGKKIKILWYPIIASDVDFSRELSRSLWYINPIFDKVDRIDFLVKNVFVFKENDFTDSTISHIFNKFNKKNKIFQVFNITDDYDVVYVWKDKVRVSFFDFNIFCSILNRYEGNIMHRLHNIVSPVCKKSPILDTFLQNIKAENKNVILLGSGPSLSHFDFNLINVSRYNIIVCNSVINNVDLMLKLKPKIIVATDAVFHSGYSKYSEKFRKQLVYIMKLLKDTIFITTSREYNIYMHNLNIDKSISERFCFLNFSGSIDFNINLIENQIVKSTSNVLTFMLIPIASTITNKEIVFIGFDGKNNDAKTFWSYDLKAQFNNELKYLKLSHPGFFNLDYKHYYDKHCIELAKILKILHKNNYIIKSYFTNIPELKKYIYCFNGKS